MAFSAGEIEAVLRLRDEMSAKLREASGVLAKFGGDAQTTTAKLSAFGSSATAAGTALSLGITAPILAAAGASVYFSGQFESTMVKLNTLAGVSSEKLGMVKDHILDLAPAVGIGPQALALAMTKVSSTVSNTTTALDILDISARGSAAGLGEAVDVAGALTSVINSYGAENITAARAGDILTQAIKDGGAEAKELAPTLANVVPFASAMGISFEEVAANIATMTKLGIPATEAVTSLTSVMTAMNKPSKEGEEALGKMGKTFGMLRQEIKDKGLAATLIDLKTSFAGNSEELIKIFGRVEGFKNILGTAASQAETYTLVLKNMGESSKGAGVLQEAFNEITKTQQHSLSSLTAQVQVIAIRFGDALAPSLAKVIEMAKPLLEKILGLAEGFGKLDPTTQKIIIGAVALVAAIGPVLLILGQLAMGLAAVIAIAPAVGAAVTFMTGPFGLFALAAVAAIAIIVKFKSDLKRLENSSADAAKGFEYIGEKGQQLAKDFKEVVESNKTLVKATDGTTAVIGLGARALLQFGDASEESQRKVKVLTKEVELEALITEEAKNAIEEHRKAVSKLTEEFKGNAEGTKVIQDAFIALTQSGKELSGEVSARLIPELDKLREAGVTLTQSQNDAYAAGIKHKGGLTEQGVEVLKTADVTLQMIDAQKSLGRTEDEIAQQFHVTKEVLKTYENGLKNAANDTDQLAKATLDADIAIAKSGGDTLASRLRIIALNQDAELAADAMRISGTSKSAQIILKYHAEEFETLKTLRDADSQAESIRGLSDQEAKLKIIEDGLKKEVDAIRATSGIEKSVGKETTDILIREAERKKQAVLGIEKILQDNSVAHLRELARTAAATYAEMAKAPTGTYLPATLSAFKMAADASQLASQGQILDIGALEKASGADLRKIADTAKTTYEYAAAHSKDSYDAQGNFVKGFSAQAIESLRRISVQTEENTKSSITFGGALGELSGLFVSLGQIAGGSLGQIFSALGATTAMLKSSSEAAKESGGQFGYMSAALDGNADSSKRLAAGVMAVGAIAQGVSNVMKATSEHATAAGNAMGGAMAGMQAGAAFGPWGMAVGAAAGFMVGLIKGKPEWAKAADDISRDFGVKISDALAKTIAAQAKKDFGGNLVASAISSLSSIIKEAGGLTESNLPQMTARLRDVFVMIETHQMTIAQGSKVLNENFAAFAVAGTSATGLISKGLLEIIQLNDRFGTNSASISKYVTSETTKAVGGLTTFLSVGAKAYDTLSEKEKALGDLKKKVVDTETQYADKRNKLNKDDKDYKEQLAELLKEELAERAKITTEMDALSQGIEKQKLIIEATAISSQAAATAMSGAIVASFVELQKQGMSVTEALKAVQPAIKAMETQLIASGLSGGNAFLGLQKMAKMAGDEIAGPALDAVGGLNEAMKGLHNAGLMDQEMFTGLSGQISSTFNTLVAQGHDGNTAMMLMQPSLQTIWELQKDFGYAVDEGTQLLLDQAVAAGVVGGKHQDVQKQVLDVLERIAKVLGADLPAASRAAETQAATSAQRIEKELNAIEVERIDIQAVAEVHWDYDTFVVPDVTVDAPDGAMLGGLVTQDGIQRLSHGGMVRGYARGTDTVPAMLTPGEAVLTTRAVGTLGTSAISRLNNGGSMSNDDVISELRLLRKQQAASDRQLPLLVALSVRDAMQLNR